MTRAQIRKLLNQYGFPCGIGGYKQRLAVKRFQRAYNAGPWLKVDGIAGPKTQKALSKLPRLSAHFTVYELRSKGNKTCYVRRELLAALEVLRRKVGPIVIVSAYRDPAHNKRVGGAKYSMHVLGWAADIAPKPLGKVTSVRRFSGVGTKGRYVVHVDLRHYAGDKNKTPGATVRNPARWRY